MLFFHSAKILKTLFVGLLLCFPAKSADKMIAINDRAAELCKWGEQIFYGNEYKSDWPQVKCQNCETHPKRIVCLTGMSAAEIETFLENPPTMTVPHIYFNDDMKSSTIDKSNDSLYELAQNYGKQKDFKKALHCYSEAAQKGHVESMRHLAMMHYHWHMTLDQSIMKLFDEPKNFYLAFYFMTQAADGESKVAQCALGQFYFHGQKKNGTLLLPQNYEKAFIYFSKAADQKWPEAQYMLGQIYNEGRYVNKDGEKAKQYFQLSAAQGQKEAINALENLN